MWVRSIQAVFKAALNLQEVSQKTFLKSNQISFENVASMLEKCQESKQICGQGTVQSSLQCFQCAGYELEKETTQTKETL